jgi:orotidine-5'-phosphate decarboxylase
LRQVVEALGERLQVLAVTVLTSLGPADLMALGYDPPKAQNPVDLVLHQAVLAQEAGCHGVVCSGWEAKAVKERCGKDFLVVCPGIRPAWAAVPGDDQSRFLTPAQGIEAGADYLVVGRPIRIAEDPIAAAQEVVAEIAAALARQLRES